MGTMTTPNHAVSVTLAAEHWLRIEQALMAAESQLHRTGNTKHAWRYHHTRQLIQHVTNAWDHSGGVEVPHAWEAEQ
jgi:hypothetical protein